MQAVRRVQNVNRMSWRLVATLHLVTFIVGLLCIGCGDTEDEMELRPGDPGNTALWCDPDSDGGYGLIGDLGGLEAMARVTFEFLPEYAVMAGEIRSATAYYTFTSDIVGVSGYGDMVDHTIGDRFRVKFDLSSDGFLLTANPLQSPTSYWFACK